MLVYIDESGDAGFRVEQGSSPVFVAAMVTFEDAEDTAFTRRLIEGSAARLVHKGEFKFSKTRTDVRDRFFRAVAAGPFRVRAIVVQREVIRSDHVRSDKESFYEFFVKQMLRHDGGRLSDARVIIDGSGDREFRKKLSTAVRKKMRDGAVCDCRFSDSRTDPLTQLADICAGAMHRSFRTDRRDAHRWRDMLRARLDDVWTFRGERVAFPAPSPGGTGTRTPYGDSSGRGKDFASPICVGRMKSSITTLRRGGRSAGSSLPKDLSPDGRDR